MNILEHDIIIVGAGAAGLAAAKKLSAAGKQVLVLEARDRIGGRIHTFQSSSVNYPLEGGAEFIHGNLQETFRLLKEAKLDKTELKGDMWNIENGEWKQGNEFFKRADEVIKKLKTLKENISLNTFLNNYYPHDELLRAGLKDYVEGYYSGEISRISAKDFLNEWLSEDDQQYRPKGGYGALLNYMQTKIKSVGGIIQLSTIVKKIAWRKKAVTVTDHFGNLYVAQKVLITIPLGVWTADPGHKAAISFSPVIAEKQDAARQLGYGSVIKVLLVFKDIFWNQELVKQQVKRDSSNFHMLLSKNIIPTWWSQLPEEVPVLTGWLSGPKAALLKPATDENILIQSIGSLSNIFRLSTETIQSKLKQHYIFNWLTDPFTLGSYSYSTTQTAKARPVLMAPVEDTLFFAGEALYEGPEMGTVEAAFVSGAKVASEILSV